MMGRPTADCAYHTSPPGTNLAGGKHFRRFRAIPFWIQLQCLVERENGFSKTDNEGYAVSLVSQCLGGQVSGPAIL